MRPVTYDDDGGLLFVRGDGRRDCGGCGAKNDDIGREEKGRGMHIGDNGIFTAPDGGQPWTMYCLFLFFTV